jgi:hypothetical protein
MRRAETLVVSSPRARRPLRVGKVPDRIGSIVVASANLASDTHKAQALMEHPQGAPRVYLHANVAVRRDETHSAPLARASVSVQGAAHAIGRANFDSVTDCESGVAHTRKAPPLARVERFGRPFL